MGCGASTQEESADRKGTNYKLENQKPKEERSGGKEGAAAAGQPLAKDPAPTPDDTSQKPALQGREKNAPAPFIREVVEDNASFIVSHYANKPGLHGAVFAVRDSAGQIFSKEFTDAEFTSLKDNYCPSLQWSPFWRGLAGAFTKDESLIRVSNIGANLDITIKSSKEPKPTVLSISLEKSPVTTPEETFTHFIEPFIVLYKKRKDKKEAVEEATNNKKERGLKEEDAEVKEAQLNQYEATMEAGDQGMQQMEERLEPIRAEAAATQQGYQELQSRVDKAVKAIRSLKNGATMHPLDGLYSVGGARPFQHSRFSMHYVPVEKSYEPAWLQLLEDGRITEATSDDVSCLTKRPTDPEVAELVEALPDDKVWLLIDCFENLDRWNYDAFAVDEITDGRVLFYTCYTLFIKYGFISHFKLSKEVVINFLTAVQAGYYPNQYHNAMHAADVLQITHFILGPGGMKEKCRLSMEDQFAALIASAIHDYNHPGLNNNFHTRVSEYLGTLYNDRSILENHHCACVFELMNHKKYDIMQFLNDDQKKDVRDTVVEMLLSTDMGNHAKIFSAFRRRLTDAPDWGKKKEDVRLALVMAIKLADISNCGRPTELYLKWANRIADEFYLQGDAEAELCIQISPFMNRRTHERDFHKGQVSFMNYIVAPLFDSVSDLLPNLRFTLDLCGTNRDHWGG